MMEEGVDEEEGANQEEGLVFEEGSDINNKN
jgi:hypothetical protein